MPIKLIPKRKLLYGTGETSISSTITHISETTTTGITKLSELEIDANKNWQVKGITNLKEVAASMTKGDLAVHNGTILIRLPPGPISYILTSAGPLQIPTWMPPPGLTYWFPVWIYLTHTEAIVSVAHYPNKNVPIATSHKQAYGDAPADYIKRLTPAIALVDAETVIAAPNQTYNKNSPMARKYDLEIVVGGGVADDGGTQTDETAAAQNTTANDMILLPAVPAVNDAYYFGHAKVFDVMKLNIGTAGAGTWTITWEYWNGAWVALAGVTDGTTGFTAVAGNREVTFTRPGDWATCAVATITLYWIRARVSAYTDITTQPKGTQSWIRIIT